MPGKMINFRLPEADRDLLVKAAHAAGQDISHFIRWAVEEKVRDVLDNGFSPTANRPRKIRGVAYEKVDPALCVHNSTDAEVRKRVLRSTTAGFKICTRCGTKVR